MTKPKPKPLGTLVEVREGATIVRPDLAEITSHGGAYVLDVPGVHVVDGQQLEADTTAETEPVAP
jgi:hypothetical protein